MRFPITSRTAIVAFASPVLAILIIHVGLWFLYRYEIKTEIVGLIAIPYLTLGIACVVPALYSIWDSATNVSDFERLMSAMFHAAITGIVVGALAAVSDLVSNFGNKQFADISSFDILYAVFFPLVMMIGLSSVTAILGGVVASCVLKKHRSKSLVNLTAMRHEARQSKLLCLEIQTNERDRDST